jgi:hypothetical protein
VAGKATVKLSFDAWKAGKVAPAAFQVPVMEPKPTPVKGEK